MPMPRLVLQPLVENAVLHGISRLPEGGRIDIRLVQFAILYRDGERVQMSTRAGSFVTLR